MQRFSRSFVNLLLQRNFSQAKKRWFPKPKLTVVGRRANNAKEIHLMNPTSFNFNSKSESLVELPSEDEQLINRGDFFGVRSSTIQEKVELPPELKIGKLKDMMDKNLRFTAEFFVLNVLIPLEKKMEPFLDMLKSAPKVYLPLFIKCCGLMMSDIPPENRLTILDRLLESYKANGFQLDLLSFNALMEVWLENEHQFDVDQMLRTVEVDRGLTVDVEFFNNLLWGLAVKGKDAKIREMLLEMSKRGIMPNIETELPQIYSVALHGFVKNCDSMIERALQRYGDDKKIQCLSAQIRGVAASRNIELLKDLLRKNVISRKNPENYQKTERLMINLPYETIFDVIWELARKSVDGKGQEFVELTKQILERAQRTEQFFKRLFREIERHISHEYYYSATALANETERVKSMLETQRKNLFRNQIVPRFCRQMVRKRIDSKTVKEIANRLIVPHGPETRLYDDLIYAILTFKGFRHDERFKMFSEFVDLIDPERSRPHLLFPILARCPDLNDKKMILFQSKLIGYDDFSQMDSRMMVNTFYIPMLVELENDLRMMDSERLSQVSKVMESFGVKAIHTWQLLMDYTRRMNVDNKEFCFPISQNNFKQWLKDECDRFQEKIEDSSEISRLNYDLFKRLLNAGDVEKIHLFLVKLKEFPPGMNFTSDLDPLLNLYLQNANWGYVKKLLSMLSAVAIEDDLDDSFDNNKNEFARSGSSPVKNYHLLLILRRYFLECGNIQNVIEYVYELKRLFPYSEAQNNTRIESVKAAGRFFQTILNPTNENLSNQKLHEAIDLVTLLVKLGILILYGNETLTVIFIEKVLHFLGWNTAVDTWLRFQSSLYCSNGLFVLMRSAISSDDKTRLQFLIHRAKNFISPSRVNALLAVAYLSKYQLAQAEEIFKTNLFNSSDYVNIFRLLQFQRRSTAMTLEHSKLCFKYTDLRNNQNACQLFIKSWLHLCEYMGLGSAALDFYELFKSYDVQLSLQQMEKLNHICQTQENFISKWIVDEKTRVLNPVHSDSPDDFLNRYGLFKEDLENFKAGKELRTRKLAPDIFPEAEMNSEPSSVTS